MTALVARLARRVRRHSSRGVVLCYHRVAGPRPDRARLDVTPAQFAAHLAVLRTHACPMPLGDFERARRSGRLPSRAVAVTFDDGYADNLHSALPLLEAQDMPATVFITTAGIGADAEFWWDAIERICLAPQALPSRLALKAGGDEFAWTLDDVARASATDGRRPLYDALSAWFRARPVAVRTEALAQLHAWSGCASHARDTHRTLRVDELVTLAHSPLIEIGSHSVTHPALGLLRVADAFDECVESRAALARWLGVAPTLFAYPFGDGAAIGPGAAAAVREAGYAAAFTTGAQAAWRWNRSTAVPRFAVQAWDAEEFARRLDHWFDE